MEPLDILRLMVALAGICVGLWGFMGAAVVGEFLVRRLLATERQPERAYYDPPAPPMRDHGDRALSLAVARVQKRRWDLCASGRAVAVTLRRTEELWLMAQDHIAAGGRTAVRQKMMELLGMASPGAAVAAAAAEPELRAAAESAQAALLAADEAMVRALALPPEASGVAVVAGSALAAPVTPHALAGSHTPVTVMPKSAHAAAASSSTPVTVMPKSAHAAAASSSTPVTVMPKGKASAADAVAAPASPTRPANSSGPSPEWLAAEDAIAKAHAAAEAACKRAEIAAAALPRPNATRLIIVLVVVLTAFGVMMWHDWVTFFGPHLNGT